MTEQELKKLSRADLLELLLRVSEENEQLRQQLQDAQKRLASRQLEVDKAGSIAEAALRLNGVFAAAEAACAQYVENVQRLSGRQAQICERMEQQTRARCAQMLAQAQAEAAQMAAPTVRRAARHDVAQDRLNRCFDGQIPQKDPKKP